MLWVSEQMRALTAGVGKERVGGRFELTQPSVINGFSRHWASSDSISMFSMSSQNALIKMWNVNKEEIGVFPANLVRALSV